MLLQKYQCLSVLMLTSSKKLLENFCKTRIELEKFEYKCRSYITINRQSQNKPTVCIFCGSEATSDSRHTDRLQSEVVFVDSIDVKETVIHIYHERNYEWRLLRRVSISFSDSHALDAVYHRTCSTNIRTGRNIPKVSFKCL